MQRGKSRKYEHVRVGGLIYVKITLFPKYGDFARYAPGRSAYVQEAYQITAPTMPVSSRGICLGSERPITNAYRDGEQDDPLEIRALPDTLIGPALPKGNPTTRRCRAS